MPDLWMPGAEVHDLGDHAPTDQQYPPKAIAHITWDRNATAAAPQDWCDLDDLVSYFTSSGRASAPHIIWDPFSGRIAQLYPATSRSKSVADTAGGTRTNRAGRVVIQVEAVFFPYCRYQGRVYPRLVDTPCAGWDRLNAWIRSWGVPDAWPMGRPVDFTSRRDERTWETAGGWYAHAHVPENDHQDPGSWPGFTTISTAPSAEEDDMTPDEFLATRVPLAALPDGYIPNVAELLNGAKQADASVAQLRADLPEIVRSVLSEPMPEYAALPGGYRPSLSEAINGAKTADDRLAELTGMVQSLAASVDQLKAQLTKGNG